MSHQPFIPTGQVWPEVVADANRMIGYYQRRCEILLDMNARQAIENEELRRANRKQFELIELLYEALGYDYVPCQADEGDETP